MTLRKKILVGYGIALTLTAVVLVWAMAGLVELSGASDAILRENYRSILAAGHMIDALERQNGAVLRVMLGDGEEGLARFREDESVFLQWLGRAKDNVTIAGEGDVLAAIDRGYSAYLVAATKVPSARTGDAAMVSSHYHESVLPAYRTVRDACERLREMNQRVMFDASDRARRIGDRSVTSLAAIGAAALAVGLGFSLLLSRRLVQPLKEMMAASERIAEGDYDVEVPVTSRDELGDLAADFNGMAAKLKAFHNLNIGRLVAEKRKGEAVLQSIDDGLVVVDAGLDVTQINAAAARALGVDPEAAAGKHFLEVVRSDAAFRYLKQAAETGQAPRVPEGEDLLTLPAGDGEAHYQFSVTPVRSDKHMLGAVLLLRDVTKLKELERLKSEFVMAASHELRTPLTSLEMSVGLLEERAAERLTPKDRELVAVAHEELGRMRRLINDLLDLSKIEAGKMEMDLAPTPIAALFEKAVAVLRPQAGEKGVTLEAGPADGLPPVVADANKVAWILTNLVANALRYTPRGGHVRLSAVRAGPQVHVAVSDDGAGIPYKYQSRIFDKFVQVEGDPLGGTGLGLAICKEIVRAHGGTIGLDSTPGRGTTFTFTLNAAEGPEAKRS